MWPFKLIAPPPVSVFKARLSRLPDVYSETSVNGPEVRDAQQSDAAPTFAFSSASKSAWGQGEEESESDGKKKINRIKVKKGTGVKRPVSGLTT